jgi:large subunit ribosomal protein L13
VSTEIATLLQGKHKPTYTPHLAGGDFVIVLNAGKFRVSGKKLTDKIYYRHSGYPGGLKAISYERMAARHPDRVLRMAIKGMLPHNALGRQIFRKLRVYSGAEHPHSAQKPVALDI